MCAFVRVAAVREGFANSSADVLVQKRSWSWCYQGEPQVECVFAWATPQTIVDSTKAPCIEKGLEKWELASREELADLCKVYVHILECDAAHANAALVAESRRQGSRVVSHTGTIKGESKTTNTL